MKRVKILMVLCSISLHLNAANIVDVYGTEPLQSNEIIEHFGSQVSNIQSQFINEIIKLTNGSKEQDTMTAILSKKNQLIDKIKNKYNFAYVDFETITYPNDDNNHITIEVIPQNDQHRLKFIPKNNKNSPSSHLQHDLVEEMIEFSNTGLNLFFNNEYDSDVVQCPVYHCVPGFNHPKLKNTFRDQINKARQQKELLLTTLINDPSPERKTAAIYLIGYLDNPQEIISLLTEYVMYNDDGVRNSAMRVIGETMRNAQIYDINVLPFIDLLDSPFDTDRNKSLLVLLSAANTASSKELIIQNADKQLIALLRLKQPNNHDFAYAILKKISNQDFGDTNIEAWEKWLKSAKKST